MSTTPENDEILAAQPAGSRIKAILGFMLRAGISIGLIALLLANIDRDALVDQFRDLDFAWALLALTVLLALAFLQALRWQIVLKACSETIGYWDSLRIVLIGQFFNQTLPSAIGGDAVRMWEARRAGLSLRIAVTSIVIDRLLGLAAVLVLVGVGLPRMLGLIDDPIARNGYGLVIAGLIVCYVGLLAFGRVWPERLRFKLIDAVIKLSEDARLVLLAPVAASQALSLAVFAQVALGFCILALSRALDVSIPLADCILLFSPVVLFSTLPISVAGWGAREGAMVVVYGLIGLARPDALAISLLFGLISIVLGLPGGVLWLLSRRRRVAAPNQAAGVFPTSSR